MSLPKCFRKRSHSYCGRSNEEGLNVLLNQNELNNTRMKTFRLDVSDSAAVEDMVNHIANEIAPIDILINVAGFYVWDQFIR